jgi:acetolactate synthase-1/2/3 large subunit
VINFGNSASLRERESGVFQEMDQVALMRPATKWANQVLFASKVPELISICFRHAMAPPQGPVYLDMPGDAMRQEVEEENIRWPAKYRVEPRAYGDPALVRRTVEMLAAAERPLIVTGSGILWSQAHEAMQAFVNETGIPFYTTPQGRGVVPEDHPRAFLGARSFAFAQADVVLVVGTRSNNNSSFFTPPRWSREAKFIFVNLDPKEIGHNAPAEIGILGDARSVFQQLTEEAKGRFKPDEDTAWVRSLRDRDAQREAQTRALMDSEMRPMHPLRLMKEVRDFIDRDAVLVVDGHETLNFARQSIPTYVAGHRINAGTHGTMGVGVPFAIAAKAAKPDKQVVCLTGDGAFGWHGMEIDTAIRHKLNILFVVCNNGSYTAMDRDKFNPQKFLGFTRYDKMMEALGGCGEYVEEPEDIRPALERASKAGVPALVNVKVDHYTASRTQIGLHRD